MKKEFLKELLAEITHYANGGNLWYYSHSKKWMKYTDMLTPSFDTDDKTAFVIEDKHFEARKANALGESVEFIDNSGIPQTVDSNIAWSQDVIYRPKPKYPRYFREKSSGIIVKFIDLTKGEVIEGIDSPQKTTGFIWNCFHPHDKTDWWEECNAPIYEWQWYKVMFESVFELTPTHHVEYNNGWTKFEPSKKFKECSCL